MLLIMREAIGVGETVEIATQKAYQALGVENAEIEVLELPEKKLFGLFGGKPAKVRAYVKDSPVSAAVEYLQGILSGMGAEKIEIGAEETEDGVVLNISGEDSGVVIGHHGETLDALQYLVGMAANRVCEKYYRVTMNVGDYREKREGTLCALAKRIAKKAITNGRRYSLEPMNPYERRIIHTAVQEMEGVTSWSEGSDMERHVVIGPEGGSQRSERGGRNNRERSENRNGHNRNRGGRRNNEQRNAARQDLPKEESIAAANLVSDVKSEPKVIDEVPAIEIPKKENVSSGNKEDSEKVPLYGRITPSGK